MFAAVLAAALTLASPLASPQDPEPSEAKLQRAWKKLSADERREVAEWYRLEIGFVATFQGTLVRHVLDTLEEDPGLWPEPGPLPLFDPETHAPAQPIARKWLEPGSSSVRRAREKLLVAPARKLTSAWTYDWSRGLPLRVGDPDDPELLFANALAGWLPDADLAEVVVLSILDRGDERPALAAWGHGYTNRTGGAYPGITLYDAWSSGAEMEMPDIDTLGIYHALTGDFARFVAPVPPSKMQPLYTDLGERFRRARSYRELREAAARAYLHADPVLPVGYEPSLVRLHALWEKSTSSPAVLREQLPDGEGWAKFLESWAKSCEKEPELLEGGQTRRGALAWDAATMRATLTRVMQEFGALD